MLINALFYAYSFLHSNKDYRKNAVKILSQDKVLMILFSISDGFSV